MVVVTVTHTPTSNRVARGNRPSFLTRGEIPVTVTECNSSVQMVVVDEEEVVGLLLGLSAVSRISCCVYYAIVALIPSRNTQYSTLLNPEKESHIIHNPYNERHVASHTHLLQLLTDNKVYV